MQLNSGLYVCNELSVWHLCCEGCTPLIEAHLIYENALCFHEMRELRPERWPTSDFIPSFRDLLSRGRLRKLMICRSCTTLSSSPWFLQHGHRREPTILGIRACHKDGNNSGASDQVLSTAGYIYKLRFEETTTPRGSIQFDFS